MRPRPGFTLIEVLLAFAITALFMGLLGATLSGTLRAARTVAASSDIRQEARAVLALISADVSSAMYAGHEIESFLGEDSLRGPMPADSLHLVGASQPLFSGGTPYEVSYTVREGSGKMILVRREAHPVDRRPTVGGAEIEVSSSLVGLNFRYFDGKAWRDSWSAESEGYLPLAVRAEILLLANEDQEPQLFSEVVPVLAGGKREAN